MELEFNEEMDHFFVIASLGRMPEEESELFWRFLLRSNYLGHGTRQATVGLGEDHEIVVHMGRPIRWIREEELAQMIDAVSDAAVFLEQMLGEDRWRSLFDLVDQGKPSEEMEDSPGLSTGMAWMSSRA